MSFIINITNTSGTTGTIEPDVGFSYTDSLNRINKGNLKFSGIGAIRRGLLEVGSEVEIKRNGTREFYGLVDDINYLTGGAVVANMNGFEIWLGLENGTYASSPYTNIASATIATDIITESTKFTVGTINTGSNIDFRIDLTDSLYNALSNLTRKVQQDIGINYTTFKVDVLNNKGSTTSVATLNAGVEISNVRINQFFPKGNIIKVIGSSEGQTKITATAEDATSKATFGNITLVIRDRTISTTAEAQKLADAELIVNKDPIKVYDFDVNNFGLNIVSGDVLTLNAHAQNISNESVRVVGVERGINGGEEFMILQVTNTEYSRSVRRRNEIIAEIERNSRQGEAYTQFGDEYSNQNVDTTVGGFMTATLIGAVLNNVRQIANVGAITIGSTSPNRIFLIPSNGDGSAPVEVQGDIDLLGNDLLNAGNLTGTQFWSCSGTDFKDDTPNVDYINYELSTGYAVAKTLLGTAMVAPVHLPHGATITAVIVYGTSTAETWNLLKGTHQSGTFINVASANVETEDTTILGNPINNQTNFYFFRTSVINQNEKIEGARIKYTL